MFLPRNSHFKWRNSTDILLVSAQMFLLLLFFLLPEICRINFLRMFLSFGYCMALLGIITVLWACISLGKSLSPFPTPGSGTELVTNGLFKYVRHPIYSGIIFLLLGIAIAYASLMKLIIVCATLIFFNLKAAYEEKLLLRKFKEYGDYKRRTARFLPRIWKE